MRIFQVLLDGVEAGYLCALHEGPALREASRIIEGWRQEPGPPPPPWAVSLKEMYMWEVRFYTKMMWRGANTSMIGTILGTLGYDEGDVEKRVDPSYIVTKVSRASKL